MRLSASARTRDCVAAFRIKLRFLRFSDGLAKTGSPGAHGISYSFSGKRDDKFGGSPPSHCSEVSSHNSTQRSSTILGTVRAIVRFRTSAGASIVRTQILRSNGKTNLLARNIPLKEELIFYASVISRGHTMGVPLSVSVSDWCLGTFVWRLGPAGFSAKARPASGPF